MGCNAGGGTLGDAFITGWNIPSALYTLTLPVVGDSIVDCTVDWGDGTVEAFNSLPIEHEYALSEDYTIRITGTLSKWDNRLNAGVPGDQMRKVMNFGDVGMTYCRMRSLTTNGPLRSIDGSGAFPDVDPDNPNDIYTSTEIMTIPPSHFSSRSNRITDLSSCFEAAVYLRNGPGDLFANMPDLSTVNDALNQAGGQAGTSAYVNAGPGMFTGSPDVADFRDFMFSCQDVVEEIPELWVSHPTALHNTGSFDTPLSPNYADAITAGWG